MYSGKDALLARDRRGEAFSHCRTCVSKFSGVQERERNKHTAAIEEFGRQNGKRGLKGNLTYLTGGSFVENAVVC